MISLNDNRTALQNLSVTIEAIEDLDKLIAIYSNGIAAPAYCVFEGTGPSGTSVQFERSIMVTALEAQRQRLVDYLATLGIDATS